MLQLLLALTKSIFLGPGQEMFFGVVFCALEPLPLSYILRQEPAISNLMTFVLLVLLCRKFTCHVMHRARVLSSKANNNSNVAWI